MSREPSRREFKFFGGRVCLDFANTLNWRLTDAPVELIPDYAAFLSWSGDRGTLSGRTITALRQKAETRQAEVLAFMDQVHRLRADLIQSAAALWLGKVPDIRSINEAIAALPPQPELTMDDGRFVPNLDGEDLRQPLWPILWSLTAVLASEDARRIGSCGADGCGWFFADESPNHTRLWCSESCGNRERVRRSYAKRRKHTG